MEKQALCILLLPVMIYLHIVDDYHIQGILSNFKQKKWWEQNYPDKKYKNDWIIGLLLHAFQWAFVIELPCVLLAIYFNTISYNTILVVSILVINTIIHAITDHLKSNMFKISLFTDQIVHLIQITITYIIFVCFIL